MKIIITRTTFAAGELVEASKKPVEVPDKLALELIKLRKAVKAQKANESE